MDEREFQQRLDEAAAQWRRQRYTGPLPGFSVRRRRLVPLLLTGAIAAAVVVALLPSPASQEWPAELRPVLRGSPLAATAPEPPADGMGFKLPAAPSRSTCFASTEDCDKPAG